METIEQDRSAETFRALAGFLGAAVIWAVYFTAVYLLGEAACTAGFLTSKAAGVPILSVVIALLTLVALGLIGAVAWRQRETAAPSIDEVAAERGRFLRRGGMVLAVLFGLVTLLTGLPTLLLDPCFWG